jgi:hypothetical protein
MKKKNLLMTAMAIFGLATITFGQTVPSYIPTSGLVGWWPFNGNANDESGNNLNGTVLGANLTNDRNGNSNSAYNFDYLNASFSQQNQEIYIPFSPLLNVSNISVSYWVYPRQYYWTGNPNLTVNITRFQYGYSNPNGQVWGLGYTDNQVLGGLNGPNGGGTYQAIYTSAINLNAWNNIVMTYDSVTIKLFLNSQLVAVTNHNLPMNTAGNSGISIGENNSANGYWQYTDGVIDDIGIWDRALTPQEITDLFNGCQLSVNTQPSSQTININNNVQFIASSSDPSATYQWQTDLGVGFQNLNSVGQYSGTTNDTLTIANTTLSNNNQPFRCIISSGSCYDTSNVVVLTVNNNVGINEFTQDNLFSVYPNPAKSQINVKADAKLLGSVYNVYDNVGKVVLSGKINSENTVIELGNLSGGIYLFSVGENLKQTFKVIKE